jgi:hypothetical protein
LSVGRSDFLVSVAIFSGSKRWAFTDLGWAFRTSDSFSLDGLWSYTWWVGDGLADASPSVTAVHGRFDWLFVRIIASWLRSRWALAFLIVTVAVGDWDLDRDLWMGTS